jgi:hypothetical protein
MEVGTYFYNRKAQQAKTINKYQLTHNKGRMNFSQIKQVEIYSENSPKFDNISALHRVKQTLRCGGDMATQNTVQQE